MRFWTEERCDELLRLMAEGLTDEEIAIRIGRTPHAVKAQRYLMCGSGYERNRGAAVVLAPEIFPTFENITKAEARKILADAPLSAPVVRGYNRSLVGNSAAMCADKGVVTA